MTRALATSTFFRGRRGDLANRHVGPFEDRVAQGRAHQLLDRADIRLDAVQGGLHLRVAVRLLRELYFELHARERGLDLVRHRIGHVLVGGDQPVDARGHFAKRLGERINLRSRLMSASNVQFLLPKRAAARSSARRSRVSGQIQIMSTKAIAA